MTEKEWLGEDNQLGIDIWKNKYCYEGILVLLIDQDLGL